MAQTPRSRDSASPRQASKSSDSLSATAPKPSQRQRLIRAITELCAREGYQGVSVAQISSAAGVSSATFYEQFDGKEACLLAAFGEARLHLLRGMEPPAADASWRDAGRSMLEGLFAGLQADPAGGRLVFVESMSGGPLMREERERALEDQERRVEEFLESRPAGSETLDIPVAVLEGARRYVVSRHLRNHSEDLLPSRVGDMLAWASCYAVPAGKERWSNGPRALLGEEVSADKAPDPADARQERLPRGRHGLPASVVARSQRTRIIAGTADVMATKGYANTTVADIVAAAGVSRDVFYDHFADKQNAFIETQQFATQAILNTCAAAYFSATDWPERVWRALDAMLKLIAEHPAIAYVRLVESYAAGAAAVRNIEEFVRSATIFLEEGFRYAGDTCTLPRLSTQAICGGVLEVVSRHVARGENAELHRRLPQLAYIALAPFMGTEQAIDFLTEASASYSSSEES